jgi:hypothetical protein
MKDTNRATADLRATAPALPPDIDQKLSRFEAAIAHALATSPDGETIAQPEELVTLDALCDLHLAAQEQPEPLRERLRPIIDDWIAHAAMTGITPVDLETRTASQTTAQLEAWLGSDD